MKVSIGQVYQDNGPRQDERKLKVVKLEQKGRFAVAEIVGETKSNGDPKTHTFAVSRAGTSDDDDYQLVDAKKDDAK